jgi:uncharacterized protein (DUF362 family)/Pyruvate/2-oxoacid:ferredoxin oxidoreductase delta subunit
LLQPVVAVQACPSYDPETVYAAVKTACLSSAFPDVRGKRVLLKPNMLSDVPPERAVTTHPEILSAMIRFVREQGGEPAAGDSPALPLSGNNGRKSGLRSVCEQTGTPWIDFSEKTMKITTPDRSKSRSFTVTHAVREFDLIISLPKMKTHQLMYMTGAVKNLFGLIPGLAKSPYHLRFPDRSGFADMLLDLLSCIAPAFSLMDAVIAMEGPGPNSGSPVYMGHLLASADSLALDCTAAYIMGCSPGSIPLLHQAMKRGLLSQEGIAAIEFVLSRPEEFRKESFLRIEQEREPTLLRTGIGFIRNRFRRSIPSAVPVFSSEHCIGCGRCIAICPAKALQYADDTESSIAVDYSICIRCFCCHEVCPADAVTIEQKRRT